jgi:hypothetical protein
MGYWDNEIIGILTPSSIFTGACYLVKYNYKYKYKLIFFIYLYIYIFIYLYIYNRL